MNKELEALEKIMAFVCAKGNIEEINKNTEDYEIIEKSLKALEIIKKYFKYNFDEFVAKSEWYEEFEGKEDLLKEVLL